MIAFRPMKCGLNSFAPLPGPLSCSLPTGRPEQVHHILSVPEHLLCIFYEPHHLTRDSSTQGLPSPAPSSSPCSIYFQRITRPSDPLLTSVDRVPPSELRGSQEERIYSQESISSTGHPAAASSQQPAAFPGNFLEMQIESPTPDLLNEPPLCSRAQGKQGPKGGR